MECFAANNRDVTERRTAGGSIHPPAIGQVGLRCVHCTNVPLKVRAKGSVLYPKTVRAIHMAMRNFQRHHLLTCRHIPPNVKARYASIKNKAVQSKKDSYIYLAQSCKDMGVVEKGGYLQMGTEEDLTAFDPTAAQPLTSSNSQSAASVAASAAAAAAAAANGGGMFGAGVSGVGVGGLHPMLVGPGGDMSKARLMTVQAEPINRRRAEDDVASGALPRQQSAARKLNNDNVKAASGLLSLFKKTTPMTAAHAAAAAANGTPYQTAAERATAAAFEQGTLPPEYAQALAQRQQREVQRAAAAAASMYGTNAAAVHAAAAQAHAAAMQAGGGMGLPGAGPGGPAAASAAMMQQYAAMPPLPGGVPASVSAMDAAAPDHYAAYAAAAAAHARAPAAQMNEQQRLEHFYYLQIQKEKADEAAAAAAAAVEAARPLRLDGALGDGPPGLGPTPSVPPPLPGQIPGAPAPAYPGFASVAQPPPLPSAAPAAPLAAPVPGLPALAGADLGGELLDPQQLAGLGAVLNIDPATAADADPSMLSALEAQDASSGIKVAARRDYLQYLRSLNRMSTTITLAQRQASLLQSFPDNTSLQVSKEGASSRHVCLAYSIDYTFLIIFCHLCLLLRFFLEPLGGLPRDSCHHGRRDECRQDTGD